MNIYSIAGLDLIPGTTIKTSLTVKNTSLSVPFIVHSGVKPGPLLVVTAGIHNAEFVGIQAAVELAQELEPSVLSGTVIILPLVNRSGFLYRTMSRVHEDGKNLNRVFPGDLNGTEADKLAYTVFNTFLLHADAYIDLHCGDGFEELTPYVYFVGNTVCEAASSAMAECVQTDYYVRSKCTTGGAYNLASVNGIPSILIERGQLSLMPREEIDADKDDVRNIMRRLGMLPGTSRTFPKKGLTETEVFSPLSGFWYPALRAGDCFRTGQVLGTVRDAFGVPVYTLTAPEDGILLHQCASLNVLENDVMISYGKAL